MGLLRYGFSAELDRINEENNGDKHIQESEILQAFLINVYWNRSFTIRKYLHKR